jgi:protein-S-isoprenylcysteine O-methyltransferase Ste14
MSDHGSTPTSNLAARTAGSLGISLIVAALLLFVPAGTFSWARGWWFLAIFTATMVGAVLYMWRANPELFEVRRRFQPGSKQWDVVVSSLAILVMIAILPLAALDDARFHWWPMPDWVVWLGYVLFILGFALTLWAQAVNRHFELAVRIQTDRGHKVIDTGPYALVRHPGYIGAILLTAGMALALGSAVSLILVAVLIGLLGYRSVREETTLRDELEGYAEYMQRVRHRWIPGVW